MVDFIMDQKNGNARLQETPVICRSNVVRLERRKAQQNHGLLGLETDDMAKSQQEPLNLSSLYAELQRFGEASQYEKAVRTADASKMVFRSDWVFPTKSPLYKGKGCRNS